MQRQIGDTPTGTLAVLPPGFPEPQWVIVGTRVPGGVMVLASKTLSRATLEMKAKKIETIHFDDMLIRTQPNPDIFLTLEMDDFIMIHAVDYSTAFEHLFGQWSPDDGPAPTLPVFGR